MLLRSGTLMIIKHHKTYRATFVPRYEATCSVAESAGRAIDDLASFLSDVEAAPQVRDRAFLELHMTGATRVGVRNVRYESLVRYGLLEGNER
jgi:hypothetical protein